MSVGILVIGDNHFIVRGPRPDTAMARALARHWSLISIGGESPPELREWTISTREFREDLSWGVVVADPVWHSPAVERLLAEMITRGIEIEKA